MTECSTHMCHSPVLKLVAEEGKCKKHLVREIDRLCRAHVLCRDEGRCLNCFAGPAEGAILQWAHILSRRSHALRWDDSNSVCLCSRCHENFTHKPDLWEVWVEDHFPGRWNQLHLAIVDVEHSGAKPDYGFILADVRARLRSLPPGRLPAGFKIGGEADEDGGG